MASRWGRRSPPGMSTTGRKRRRCCPPWSSVRPRRWSRTRPRTSAICPTRGRTGRMGIARPGGGRRPPGSGWSRRSRGSRGAGAWGGCGARSSGGMPGSPNSGGSPGGGTGSPGGTWAGSNSLPASSSSGPRPTVFSGSSKSCLEKNGENRKNRVRGTGHGGSDKPRPVPTTHRIGTLFASHPASPL